MDASRLEVAGADRNVNLMFEMLLIRDSQNDNEAAKKMKNFGSELNFIHNYENTFLENVLLCARTIFFPSTNTKCGTCVRISNPPCPTFVGVPPKIGPFFFWTVLNWYLLRIFEGFTVCERRTKLCHSELLGLLNIHGLSITPAECPHAFQDVVTSFEVNLLFCFSPRASARI